VRLSNQGSILGPILFVIFVNDMMFSIVLIRPDSSVHRNLFENETFKPPPPFSRLMGYGRGLLICWPPN